MVTHVVTREGLMRVTAALLLLSAVLLDVFNTTFLVEKDKQPLDFLILYIINGTGPRASILNALNIGLVKVTV